jgi:hypothetical protein
MASEMRSGSSDSAWGMGRENRVAQRLSPSYSRTHLIAGAPHDWFAGDNYTPGEPNMWCAGNKVSPAIPGTCPPTWLAISFYSFLYFFSLSFYSFIFILFFISFHFLLCFFSFPTNPILFYFLLFSR